MLTLGYQGQGFEVGLLQGTSAKQIDQQAPGNARQVGPRLTDLHCVARLEHPHEGVLGQVGGIEGVAQALAQPALQPAMVMGVEVGDGTAQG